MMCVFNCLMYRTELIHNCANEYLSNIDANIDYGRALR